MLKSAVIISYNKSFDCSECVKNYNEKRRIMKLGCESYGPATRKLDSFILKKCIGNFRNPGFMRLVNIYHGYDKAGKLESSMDQSSKFIETMNIIGSFVSIEEKRIVQENKLRNKNGRK